MTQAAQKLFDLSSSTASTDHPLCEECTDNLLDELDVRLREVEEESKACKEFLEQYASEVNAGLSDESLAKSTAELEEVW